MIELVDFNEIYAKLRLKQNRQKEPVAVEVVKKPKLKQNLLAQETPVAKKSPG
jgi:hypothetical protein